MKQYLYPFDKTREIEKKLLKFKIKDINIKSEFLNLKNNLKIDICFYDRPDVLIKNKTLTNTKSIEIEDLIQNYKKLLELKRKSSFIIINYMHFRQLSDSSINEYLDKNNPKLIEKETKNINFSIPNEIESYLSNFIISKYPKLVELYLDLELQSELFGREIDSNYIHEINKISNSNIFIESVFNLIKDQRIIEIDYSKILEEKMIFKKRFDDISLINKKNLLENENQLRSFYSLKEENNALYQEKEILKNDLKTLKKKFDDISLINKKNLLENENQLRSFSLLEEKNNALYQEKEILKNDLKIIKKDHQELNEKNINLKLFIKDANKEFSKKISQLSNDYQNEMQIIDNEREKILKLKIQVEKELEKAKNDFSLEIRDLRKNNPEKISKNTEKLTNSEKLKKSIELLKVECNDYKFQYKIVSKENEILLQENTILNKKIDLQKEDIQHQKLLLRKLLKASIRSKKIIAALFDFLNPNSKGKLIKDSNIEIIP